MQAFGFPRYPSTADQSVLWFPSRARACLCRIADSAASYEISLIQLVRIFVPHNGITSRPLLLQAIGRQTRHAGRTIVTITSSRGEHQALTRIARSFSQVRKTAEQLTPIERWYRIVSETLKKFLRGRKLIPPRQTSALGSCELCLRNAGESSAQCRRIFIPVEIVRTMRGKW
jgi:hypothetical protein